MCSSPSCTDLVYFKWFLRTLLVPIDKDFTSHFPQIEEESLETSLRYDLVYGQSGYVYTIIPDLPHLGGSNAPRHLMLLTISLEIFHILRRILGRVMAICRGALIPPTLMPLLPETCIQDKAHIMHSPKHITRCQVQIVLNLSTKPLALHHLKPMHH